MQYLYNIITSGKTN